MTIPEILHQLQRLPDNGDFAPYEAALRAAREQREAITPELIAVIDRVTADPGRVLEDPMNCLQHFAILLLAEFREARALDSFWRFFSLPGETALDLTGDMVTENGAAVLVSVCGGDPEPLLRLAHDESVNEIVRGQAIDGLLVQHGWGERSRDAVIEELRRLFSTLPKPGNGFVWAALVCAILDFGAAELLPEARRAFDEDLVDPSIVGAESLNELDSPKTRKYPLPEGVTKFSLFCGRNAPIDVVAECSGWLCFRDEEPHFTSWAREMAEDELLMGQSDEDFAQRIASGEKPYIAPPKVGRNDPCPCGSGRKFKKCCGRK
ncbi:MAG: DUF1186 domain-containing protein [Verrucomicrobia bacterium]|jgi:hypothetical protein|nr:DUF1186 domain-containing protein [Verrucomicrobiota bacterium]